MPGSVFLEGETVSLRVVNPTAEADAKLIQDSINEPETRRAMGLTDPYSEYREGQFLEDMDDRDDHILFFISTDSEEAPVGNVELFDIDRTHGRAEIGCWVYEPHRERGYATAACRLLLQYAFDELRLHRIDAVAYHQNAASRALIESLGFEHEGVRRDAAYIDGEYADVHEYGLLASEFLT
jgi:RimJ/RimL family protein N-acetyltransferase